MTPFWAGMTDIFTLPGGLSALAIGVLVGVFVGLMPGLSARSSLLVALPFALSMPPLVAVVFLVAIHASAQVSSTVPAVLFGAPTNSSEAATALDGYPLAQRGEGARAIGAILSASAFGGVGGALVLLAFGAIAAQLIVFIGSPEIATLAVGGILAIALISDTSLPAGIAMGAAGILASTVGLSAFGPDPRFTFGIDELFDGLSAPALIAGALAVPELLRWYADQGALRVRAGYAEVWRGILDPIRHFWLTLRSSLIGLVVGIVPGVGLSVAVWLAYGQAARTTHPERPFGTGAIEGVIAPEAAGGAKEGGALIPTLFLGVPGSSGMAILLTAFSIIGIQAGPGLITRQPEVPSAVAATVALANIAGLVICFIAAPLMVRLAAFPRHIVVVFALLAAIAATYFAAPQTSTLVQILAFAGFGLLLARAGLSRPAFLIGFVIGPVFESAFLRSASIHGWGSLFRPGVLILALGFVIIAALLTRRGRGSPAPAMTSEGEPNRGITRAAALPLALLATLFTAALLIAPGYGPMPSLLPMTAAAIGLAASLLALWQALRRGGETRFRLDVRLAGFAALSLCAATLFGPWALLLLLGALVMRRAPSPTAETA